MWNLRGEDKLHLPCKTQEMAIYAAHLFPLVKPIGFDNHVCHVDVIASGSDIQRCFSLLQLEGEKWAGKDLARSGGSISMPTWQSNSRQHSPLSIVPSCTSIFYLQTLSQMCINFKLLCAGHRESFSRLCSISSAAMGGLSDGQQWLPHPVTPRGIAVCFQAPRNMESSKDQLSAAILGLL